VLRGVLFCMSVSLGLFYRSLSCVGHRDELFVACFLKVSLSCLCFEGGSLLHVCFIRSLLQVSCVGHRDELFVTCVLEVSLVGLFLGGVLLCMSVLLGLLCRA